VDDRPFGGGEGMVLKPEPIFEAVEEIALRGQSVEVVALCASGRVFDQTEALRLSKADQVIFLCGRYEGIDERVVETLATRELSIGNFIVSGGEVAAALIVDAVTRYVPGAVGKEGSVLNDSFSDPANVSMLVEHPHYTRPAEFRGLRVPDALLSGDHERIRRWRRREALRKTARNRPELIRLELLDDEDRRLLSEESHERH
jgi:tRNA (guanine37-N1)-methyltransferase